MPLMCWPALKNIVVGEGRNSQRPFRLNVFYARSNSIPAKKPSAWRPVSRNWIARRKNSSPQAMKISLQNSRPGSVKRWKNAMRESARKPYNHFKTGAGPIGQFKKVYFIKESFFER